MKLSIEITADGSPTLYRQDINEHYHSIKGALEESRHVYLHTGWKYTSQQFLAPLNVFEVGFGTGLNAALTARAALAHGIETNYHSVELYPLSSEATQLIVDAYEENLRSELISVNAAPWNETAEINQFFRLKKIQHNLLTMQIPLGINVVYFDAFAPEKQPEMWSEEIFRKFFSALTPRGVITTYCAKGSIRRMLEHIGFICERLPGPPAGKREILRASRPL